LKNFDLISLDTVDFSQFIEIKSREKWYGHQDHSRWIFKDDKNGLYYKVWNETYVRKDTIPQAFHLGFYDKELLPSLVGLLYWENVCRGYVMRECQNYGKIDVDFFEKIKQKTKESNLFAYDFCPNHIVKFNECTTLIDLEGVYNLNEYKQKEKEHFRLGIPGRFVEYKPYDDFIKSINYVPLNLDKFLNMTIHAGGGGKEIITQNGKLKTIKDVVKFFSSSDNVNNVIREQINPSNWQYFNCMLAEFKHDVADHHELGWENMTKEYYDSLKSMTDDEIELFQKNNPAEFTIGSVKHSMHRACAMIGRLINGKKYIPFYVEREVENPLLNINHLDKLKDWPKSEYTIVQSGILALMGVRQNGDLDVVISSKLKDKLTSVPENVEVMENRGKFRIFNDITSDDDLVYNYSKNIGGYNFLEPRFYFKRLWPDKQSKIQDQTKILQFQERGGQLCYPYSEFSIEQWGFNLLPKGVQYD
tara:strand:- start:652 stop:2076 length:1425 start_codon:yes stop_codon:yes gene_type:complete